MENPLVILGGDGVLYRAVRDVGGVLRPLVINDSGCPECCDEKPPVDCDAPSNANVCVRVTFGGLTLQDDCDVFLFPNCEPPRQGWSDVDGLLTNINKSYTVNLVGLPAAGLFRGTGFALLRYVEPDCASQGGGVVIKTLLDITVRLGCFDDQLQVTTVDLGFRLSSLRINSVFSYSGAPIPVGQPIPNQNGCVNGDGNVSHSGQAVVTVTIDSECDNTNPPVVARRCTDPMEQIAVDLSENPLLLPNAIYQGNLYRITAEPSSDDPVTVEFTDDPCGEEDEFYIATKCNPSTTSPATVRYRRVDGLPPGEGLIQALIPAPQFGEFCVQLVKYRPTTTPTSDTSLRLEQVRPGTPCIGPDTIYCPNDTPTQIDIDDICFRCAGYVNPPPSVARLCDLICNNRSTTPPMDPAMRAAIEAQRRASGCRGCGDAGGSDLI